jgi:alkyldihydroxyacetonephosphate synthase
MTIDRTKIRWNGWGWAAHKDDAGTNEAVWTWLAGELGMPALLATPARALEESALPASRLDQDERRVLTTVVGADRVREDAYERAFHARGRSYHDLLYLRAGEFPALPDAVVYPRSTEEVLSVLALATERGIAVVPYGGGTSVVGAVTAAQGSFKAVLTLDLSGMDRVLDIDTVSLTATAEAGIYGPALEKALKAKNFTLGHYPQSYEFSTLGGWIAHRGAGQNSNLYGRAADWLVGVKLATPRGLMATVDAPASSAGPQIKDLVLGSEGLFGVVTEAKIRVRQIPAASDYRGYLFRDFASGAEAIREAAQAGVPSAMLRLSDGDETRFYRSFGSMGKKPSLSSRLADVYLETRKFDDKAAALIAGFEGEASTVTEGRNAFDKIARRLGALALGQRQGQRWREGRFHGPYLRDPMMDRGLGVDTLETAASWSKIDALYRSVRAALENAMRATAPRPEAHGVVLCHISHSYADGASLYFTYFFPRALGNEVAQWKEIKKAAGDAIAAQGATISHHHGVGEDHLAWMKSEDGALGLDVLRAIKQSLDPKGILNPGKLIPA